MDYRSASASSSRSGNRYFDTYGSIARDDERPGIVKPSFASSSGSHLPASLGLGSGPTAASPRNGLGTRPGALHAERRVLSDGKLVAHVTPNQGPAYFGSGNLASSTYGMAPGGLGSGDWHESPRVVRRTPIPGLPPGAQLLESAAPPSAARNFLVPIGSTGARQKLSIANASQRRKLATSDEVRWPTQLPGDPPPTGVSTGSSSSGAGGIAPPPHFATIPRSRSEGLFKVSGPDGARPSEIADSQSASQTSNGFSESMHRRLASSQSSSSLASTSTGLSNGAATRTHGGRSEYRRPGSAASTYTFGTSDGPASAAASPRDPSTRPPIMARGNSLPPEGTAKPVARDLPERSLTSTEIVQAARARASGLRTDSPMGMSASTARRGVASPPAGASSQDPQTPPPPPDKPWRTRDAHGTANGDEARDAGAAHQSDASLPTTGGPRTPGGSRLGLKGMFMKKEPSLEDLSGQRGGPTDSEGRGGEVLSSAELYKRSMLERDLQRHSPAAEVVELAISEDTPTERAAQLNGSADTEPRPFSTLSARPVSQRAPTIDFDIPESSFFDLTDEASDGSPVASSRNGRLSSGDSRRDYSTEDSDRSTGSFEGAYIHPALASADSPSQRPAGLPSDREVPLAGYKDSRGGSARDPVPRAAPTATPDGRANSALRSAAETRPDVASESAENTPRLAAAETFESGTGTTPHPVVSDLKLGQTRPLDSSASAGLDDPLATPKRSRSTDIGAGMNAAPAVPATSKHRATASNSSSPRTHPAALGGLSGVDVGPVPSTSSPRGAQPRAASSHELPTAIGRGQAVAGGTPMRDLAKVSFEDGDMIPASAPSAAPWQRPMEPSRALSPEIRQSRFSEASTDASDSRTPTRNENRLSALESSDVADESEDAEDESSMDGQMLPSSAWTEVENALRKFRDRNPAAAADRGNLLRTVLLPFLALEAETASVEVVGSGIYVQGKARRALFFEWIRYLLLELQHVQTSADRGAILESIACIIESRNFSTGVLGQDDGDEARFSSVFGHILSYAIGELNKKGVYQNTLIFSGRLLAVAFFRVDGVATKLLRALPVNRFALERVAKEAGWQQSRPTDFEKFRAKFPASLRQLCFKDARSYLKMLDNESVSAGSEVGAEDDRFLVRQPEVEVEMTGNWLRRWQSDDSELFFSFCRSYHRQLACLFASSKQLESVNQHFFGGPGYAHLATCVHQKCLALVHRVILSVTTLSSQKNFNPAGETANVLLGSTAGKPRVLEAANRRCTAIVVDIVRAPSGGNMIFAPMLGLHIKCLVKRTSLYDVQGVFCLLDWLDGVLGHIDQAELIGEGLIDVSFVITTIGLLLEEADHALALMRTIAFCYANFGVLTATKDNRTRFCEEILLKPKVFNKLFLSWSFTIRAYFLHLLVFRLARINDFPHPHDDPQGKTAVSIARLFNQRLEAIRKRHDQLSPLTDSSSDGDKSETEEKMKRRTASSFVSTIKKTPSITGVEAGGAVKPKAERLLGSGAGGSEASRRSEEKPQSKAKNWLRALRGAKGSKGSASSNGADGGRNKAGSIDEDGDEDAHVPLSPASLPSSPPLRDSDSLSDASTLDGSVGLLGLGPVKLAPFEFEISSKEEKESNGLANHIASMPVGHDAGIASDATFDLQNATPQPPTPGARSSMHSPRVSKAFSRRSSMLPGPASELAGLNDFEMPPLPEFPAHLSQAYEETLHVYAVQSLREYEQTVQEHDEFFASLPKDQGVQVPRLPVNWPAMWSSTGE
ncbi:uncharacterized protein PFL1_03064 [Pseudozyma flocculosa PF-1]|uniref:Uncharacterized protein n=2 Tax=Pseudozyma flocculosa TaxID=84751 RepID=A0A5C3EZX3_9BASI|nr:uncharacterized protein PFL1_03064 [Pseudozyma flocculosa PF-1]EPQ29309.1 hypothetical protein PFL1_03064 [Pseudozyma flocculosa PF-1]SPO37823.1 uncharacterized protein PSFLO_03300 [Pseudozyma flocculosa]